MELLKNNDLGLFLIYISSGILLSLVFDIFRALRKSIKTPDCITYIEDIIFSIFIFISLFYLFFKFNSGNLRLFIFIGLAIGIIIYYFSFSKYFMKLFISIITLIVNILILPLKIFIKINKKISCIICINLQNIAKIFNKIHYSIFKNKKISKNKGFNNNL